MNRVRVATLALLLAVAILCAAAYAQQPPASSTPDFPGGPTFFGSGPGSPFGAAQGGGFQSADAQLARQYIKAEKEEEKRDLRKKLAEVLGKQFDQHAQQQQKELEELEKQVASLKVLLRKRVESRSTIIDRRLEQLIQEAEGLGWNAPSGSRGGMMGGFGRGGFAPAGNLPPGGQAK